jgi:RecB family endonuclease NucS
LSPAHLDADQKVWCTGSLSGEDAKAVLEQAIRQKRLVQILGSCHVEYQGRARSVLSEGERLLLLKPDGSILVHQATGVEPVNWQPPGATLKVALKDGKLVLQATRAKARETVQITFSTLLSLTLSTLQDAGQFSMYLTEEEMQRVLALHPELIEAGLHTVWRERRVVPGFIDILARDRAGRFVVVEIKRGRADRDAVLQLHSYVRSLQATEDTGSPLRGILVAPSLAKGTQALLEQLGLEYRKVAPSNCYQHLREVETRRLTEYVSGGQSIQPSETDPDQ